MVKVKFITRGANSAFGGFSAGDVLHCSEDMAKHLVDEVCCAKYDAPKAEKHEPKPSSKKQAKPKE